MSSPRRDVAPRTGPDVPLDPSPAQARALLDVAAALSRALTASDVKQVILRHAVPLAGADAGTIVRDVDGGHLVVFGASGYDDETRLAWRHFPSDGVLPVTVAVREGREVLLSRAEAERDFPDLVPLLRPSTRALAALPLLTGDEVHAALTLAFPDEAALAPDRVAFLRALVRLCEPALERARRFDEEHRARERAALLAEAGEVLASSLDVHPTLERLTALAIEHVAEWAAVYLPDPRGLMVPVAVAHRDPELVELLRWVVDRYPSDPETPGSPPWVMHTGQPFLLPSVPPEAIEAIEDPVQRDAVRRMGFHSLIHVPLVANGRPLGVLGLATGEPQRVYGPDDLALAEALASRAAQALHNARRHESSRHAEERYRSLIDATRQIVWTNTAEGRMEGAQPGWSALTGQTEAEYRGYGWSARVHPDDLAHALGDWRRAVETRSVYETHQRVLVRDGSLRHFHVRGVPVLDERGEVREWVGVHTDITERREAEERLRASEDRFRRLVQSSPVGIAVGSPDGRLLLPNEAYLRLLGFSRAEFEAGEMNWAALTPPEYREADERAFRQALEMGTSDPYEKEMWRRDGSRVPVGLLLARHEGHDEASVVGYVQDLTVQKAAERTLLDHSAELERRVEERTRALEEQRAELDARTRALERSNAELERFAYVASHDLQEPLRTIASFAEIVERRYGDRLDDKGRQYLGLVIRGAARLKTLIDDLLVFSRLNTVRDPLRPLDAGRPAREAMSRLAAAIEAAEARVEVAPLPRVLGDEGELTQLFQNLIGNAVKFRREGVTPTVDVGWARRGELAQLWVSDNGIGIEAGFRERVFGLFQRLHTREKYEGTGLGLAIVRKIVERHGGEVWLDSVPGQGTTVRFTLPLAPPARP